MAQKIKNPTSIHEALLSGSGIQHSWELWGSSHMQPESSIAVAVVWASGYGSSSTPSLGTSICPRCSPKTKIKTKNKTNKKTKTKKNNLWNERK